MADLLRQGRRVQQQQERQQQLRAQGERAAEVAKLQDQLIEARAEMVTQLTELVESQEELARVRQLATTNPKLESVALPVPEPLVVEQSDLKIKQSDLEIKQSDLEIKQRDLEIKQRDLEDWVKMEPPVKTPASPVADEIPPPVPARKRTEISVDGKDTAEWRVMRDEALATRAWERTSVPMDAIYADLVSFLYLEDPFVAFDSDVRVTEIVTKIKATIKTDVAIPEEVEKHLLATHVWVSKRDVPVLAAFLADFSKRMVTQIKHATVAQLAAAFDSASQPQEPLTPSSPRPAICLVDLV